MQGMRLFSNVNLDKQVTFLVTLMKLMGTLQHKFKNEADFGDKTVFWILAEREWKIWYAEESNRDCRWSNQANGSPIQGHQWRSVEIYPYC